MAKIWNDGYKKLKGKRVETEGSQLEEVLAQFKRFREGKGTDSKIVTVISAKEILREGAEFCPEQYLPQPIFPENEQEVYREDML